MGWRAALGAECIGCLRQQPDGKQRKAEQYAVYALLQQLQQVLFVARKLADVACANNDRQCKQQTGVCAQGLRLDSQGDG